MAKWVEGTVIWNHRWTDRLHSLQIDAPVEPFQAGQFTRLGLEIDGEIVGRPYSYVNSPQQKPLEFYFIEVPDGPLSERLLGLRDGDAIYVAPRAAGFFTLAEVPEADHLWLLSTGTAIGPFLSILGTEEPWARFSKIVLVHAVRTEEELVYQPEIEQLLKQHPDQLTMIPFVSREDTQHAIKARVPAAIEDGRLEARAGITISAEHSQVMICGNPEMVNDTMDVLIARGLTKNRRKTPGQITTENYWKPAV